MLFSLAVAVMLCALCPAVLFCINLRRYREPGVAGSLELPAVSLLIPARNEERAIGALVESVLLSRGVELEVIVMDDGSTDRTSAIVREIAERDARVRLEEAPALSPGWNGKQHACWHLARAAANDLLCFVDADVRLEPEAIARMAAFLRGGDAALVSGFPRQVTETWMEWMLLPLIHFVLLGFLPMAGMRRGTDPSFAAGCGQFMMVGRAAYFAVGGHSAIRETMHDGLRLPKLLRQHGYRTDLADLTHLVQCRMYTNARQVWQGLAKNATEGLGAPVRILPVSVLLWMGQIMPFALAIWLAMRHGTPAYVWACVLAAVAGAWLPRALAAMRFQQAWRGAALHPLGVFLLLVLQWYALGKKITRANVSWKERTYVRD